jgi:transposase-like protein
VYKRQAVELVVSSGRSVTSVAKELGLRDSVLRRWVEKPEQGPTTAARRPITQATDGSKPNVTIATLLRDAIEDQNVKAETIANEFGQPVADIVLEVTNDKSLPKAERKRLQVEQALHKSREAKLIKLADKISNVRVIADSPASDWTAKRRMDYVQWARDVVARLRGTSDSLEEKIDEEAMRAEASI